MTPWLADDRRSVSDRKYGRWRGLPTYYRAQLEMSLGIYLAYRAQVVGWLAGSLIQPLVLIPAWQTTTGDGQIGGYSQGLFVTYFVVETLVTFLTLNFVVIEFGARVQHGYFSQVLLRPVHPIHHDICTVVAYRIVGAVVMVPSLLLLTVVFGADTSALSMSGLVAFLPAVLLASLMRFVLEWMVGCLAFWFVRTSALNAAYYSMMLLLSGSLMPLSVLPQWAQSGAAATPFPWMVAFPVEVAMGTRTGAQVWMGLGWQVVWTCVIVLLLPLVWKHAARRHSAVGG
ncbi:ABC-2 family transporter protein [Nocardioides carbamazepini]|uniref:ABC transporter permease n=1 Tax=Nocardioides carbamazepini TaxID=2854259 RepID=UPI00214A3C87|nr:ABC-2 family transporter protein [Nocardioides carbamazepini]MCR1783073.1 ABC-2 family transporter protein [Nocardioides carbamazepini]